MRVIQSKATGTIILGFMVTMVVFSQDIYFQEEWRSSLPPLLKNMNGDIVDTPDKWFNNRRPYLLSQFENQMYGSTPDNTDVRWEFIKSSEYRNALEGKAIKKEIVIRVMRGAQFRDLWLLIYLPTGQSGPIPVFLGLNFNGNHTILNDPSITITPNWIDENNRLKRFAPGNIEQSRGNAASRWPVGDILSRGYGVATIFCGDMDPDYDDGFQNGIHPLFFADGQGVPDKNDWGSIGAWAWGLSRAIDYFENDPEIDATRVAVFGHSRLGKTALWAGATDQRIALTISNNSGCGGAALSIRRQGETVEKINSGFPHWFCDNFLQYNEREDQLPVDQHMLIALIAPRPVYIASAEQDLWADPIGEYLSAYYAQPAYELVGKSTGLEPELPVINDPKKDGIIGYHIRTGGHDVTNYDWEQFLDFADKHLSVEER